jgi:hypothetical protein
MSDTKNPTPLQPPVAPPPAPPASTDPQVLLAQLQLQKLLKETALADAVLENAAAARKQNAINEENKRLMLKRRHQSCSHLMENNKTFLGGQRDHSGHTHYICQFCGAEFDETTVPPMLKPPLMNIGGPNN